MRAGPCCVKSRVCGAPDLHRTFMRPKQPTPAATANMRVSFDPIRIAPARSPQSSRRSSPRRSRAAQTPQRDVRDPGVIATDQRVTPAGVQSVFDWRVTGVRFGTPSDAVGRRPGVRVPHRLGGQPRDRSWPIRRPLRRAGRRDRSRESARTREHRSDGYRAGSPQSAIARVCARSRARTRSPSSRSLRATRPATASAPRSLVRRAR